MSDGHQRRPPAVASEAMVATSQPLATRAGLRALERGGNAADAALAAAAMLCVSEPMSTGIGGDCFAIVWEGGEVAGLDAAGPAPMDAEPLIPVEESGPRSVTVPGAVAGSAAPAERFGRLGLGIAASAAVLAALLAGCRDAAEGPEPPVEQVARELARAGADSVVVFVSDGDREYVATAGSRRPGAGQRFRIGSVTKTFTAAIVLQLAAERKLGLDDPLDAYLPGVVPDGERITIRQLLEHRSGLANVTDYQDWLMRASRSSSTSPSGTLRFAASKPLVFPPGSRFGYSNTNYIALGLVIEKTAGRTYRQELEERILDPLELEEAELPSTRRLEDLDDEGENPNLAWAAGAIVSDAPDIARFYSALLGGDVLTDDSLAEMKKTARVDLGPDSGGLGIFKESLPCGGFWGHDGGILDYGTMVRSSEDGSRVLVISVRGALSGEPPDTAALLCPPEAGSSG